MRQAFRRRMQRRFPRRLRIAGFCAFGADGSRIALPRTRSNEATYSASCSKPLRGKKNRKAKKQTKWEVNTTQLWITTLWHLGTQLPWSWRLGPCDSSERDHLSGMLGELPPDSLMVIDAGFYGYSLWRDMMEVGCEFVVRVGSNVHLLKKLGYTRTRGDIVYFWPVREARKKQPPLVLRLVVLRDKRHPVYLVTSVLDSKQLSCQDVVRLYEHRWGIELFYRHLKQTFDRRKLRSRNAANAHTEAQWSLLGLWAMALHAQHFQQSRRLDPNQLSCAGMLRAYRRAMREFKSQPEDGED
ncbi:MAG: IS4 family transposase, partial [Burkholderiales bacterium]|nr:IS4 family transposase [Burkholderiales bacterium]